MTNTTKTNSTTTVTETDRPNCALWAGGTDEECGQNSDGLCPLCRDLSDQHDREERARLVATPKMVVPNSERPEDVQYAGTYPVASRAVGVAYIPNDVYELNRNTVHALLGDLFKSERFTTIESSNECGTYFTVIDRDSHLDNGDFVYSTLAGLVQSFDGYVL